MVAITDGGKNMEDWIPHDVRDAADINQRLPNRRIQHRDTKSHCVAREGGCGEREPRR